MANEGLATVVNNWQTTLTADVTASATTLPVVTTTGMPTAGIVTCRREVIFYTDKTATTFTGCTRGADGTTAAAHLANSRVRSGPVAANHNDVVAAIAALGGGGAALAYVICTDGNNQSIPNNTSTDVTWATEVEDTFGFHVAAGANFVVPSGQAGIYLVMAQGQWAAGGTGKRELQIHITAIDAMGRFASAPISTAGSVQVSGIYRLAVGNNVRVVAFQDSGGALNIQGASVASRFVMVRLGS